MTPHKTKLLRTRAATGSALAAALSLTTLLAGCGDAGVPDDLIDRRVFIATYVDLRASELTAPEGQLSEEQRARILASHGVTAEDLVAFAEVHGEDLEYMRELWDEVELTLDARPSSSPRP